MMVRDVVREEAAKFGRTITDGEIEYVVWEFTGYPCFWPDAAKTPEENFRAQLAEFFADPDAAHDRRDDEERRVLAAARNEEALFHLAATLRRCA